MKLEIVSPDGILFEGETESAIHCRMFLFDANG